jgi:hypothetical protein
MSGGTDKRAEVIGFGRWTSDGTQGFLWIIRQTWDFYYEEFYDEGPDLSSEGWAYYVLYGTEPQLERAVSRSRTCMSMQEAAKLAEDTVGEIEWVQLGSDPPPCPP